MIDHGTLLSIPFLKKSRFTGSDRGMRYSIYKVEETRVIPNEDTSNDASEEAPKEEKVTLLEAAACPGPFFRRFLQSQSCLQKSVFHLMMKDVQPQLTGSMSSTKKSASSLRMFIIIRINIIKSIIKRTNKRFVWQDTCIFIKMWYDSKGKHCSFCC